MRTIPINMLKQIFTYDPISGLVYWAIPRQNGIRPGDVAGKVDSSTGYTRVMFAQKMLKVHRIAWALYHEEWPSLDIDHINGNRSDNRMSNLRLATRAENIRNAKKWSDKKGLLKGSTPYPGYEGKFIARIRIDGKQKHLGVFDSEYEAHNAYCDAAKKVFGEFFNPDCSCHQSGCSN